VGANLTQPLANVTITIGGQPANVLYAGGSPGLVEGFLQINVRIPATVRAEQGYGALIALNPKNGEKVWQVKFADLTEGGVLSTAGDVVFTGNREGYFDAFDARDGKLLWKSSLGGYIAAGPVSYAVDGKQYVAVAAGHGMFVFGLRE
jgi:outer membrane protein assembly factor BamB